MVIIWLMMVNNNLIGGWPTPLKNHGVSNSWDDDIPNFPIYGKINMFQNNQFLSFFLFAFQAIARLQCFFHSINVKGLNKARINVLPITKQDAIEYVAFSCAHKKTFCFHKNHIELSSYNQLWQHPPDQPKVLRAITAQKKDQKGMWPPISPHVSTWQTGFEPWMPPTLEAQPSDTLPHAVGA